MSTDDWLAGRLVTLAKAPVKPAAPVVVAPKLRAVETSPPTRVTRIVALPPSVTLPPPTAATESSGGPSSSAIVSVAEVALPGLTPPSTSVLVSVPRATATVSAVVSLSPLAVAVKVTVASCTTSVACPVKVTVGEAVFASLIDTPVPDAVTVNRGLAEPGSAAPVVVVSANGTLTTSGELLNRSSVTGRSTRIVIVTELVTSSSVMVPPPARLTNVDSLSWIVTMLLRPSNEPPENA